MKAAKAMQVQTQTVGYRPRPGRLILAVLLALAVTLAPVTPARSETGQSSGEQRALVCTMQPTRLGRKCFCRGAYGWRPAAAFMCWWSAR